MADKLEVLEDLYPYNGLGIRSIMVRIRPWSSMALIVTSTRVVLPQLNQRIYSFH